MGSAIRAARAAWALAAIGWGVAAYAAVALAPLGSWTPTRAGPLAIAAGSCGLVSLAAVRLAKRRRRMFLAAHVLAAFGALIPMLLAVLLAFNGGTPVLVFAFGVASALVLSLVFPKEW